MAAVLVGIAVTVASSSGYLPATVLAYGAIALSVTALLLGVLAVSTGRGVGWGWGGIALGVLANPLVLVWVLGALGATPSG